MSPIYSRGVPKTPVGDLHQAGHGGGHHTLRGQRCGSGAHHIPRQWGAPLRGRDRRVVLPAHAGQLHQLHQRAKQRARQVPEACDCLPPARGHHHGSVEEGKAYQEGTPRAVLEREVLCPQA